MVGGEPKRQRLSPEARRQQLIDTSIEILLEHSIHSLTVDAVAERANVSKSLVFHYFPTVRDLHLDVVRVLADVLTAEIDDSLGDGPAEERFANGVGAYIDFISRQPQSYDAISALAAADRAFGEVFDSIRQRNANLAATLFEGRTDVLGEYVLVGWVVLVETMARAWVADPAGVSREALIERIHQATAALIPVAQHTD